MYRFWLNVDKSGGVNACWKWRGYVNRHGYGVISFRGTNYKAHRVAFYLENSFIKQDKMVLHKCDVRLCCNPQHLYQGNARQNSQDALQRGRYARLYGELNGNSKLTEREVKSIKRRYKKGEATQKSLAHYHNVSKATISYICRGERWINLPDERNT
jgi:hypothetical protein